MTSVPETYGCIDARECFLPWISCEDGLSELVVG